MPIEERGKTDNSKHLNCLLGKLLTFMFFSTPNETFLPVQYSCTEEVQNVFAQMWEKSPLKNSDT